MTCCWLQTVTIELPHDIRLPYDCLCLVAVALRKCCMRQAATLHAHLVDRVMKHQGCERVHSQSYARPSLCCAFART